MKMIRVTRMGRSVIQGEDAVIYLAVKSINYVTKDEVGHTKIIMHRGAIIVEENAMEIIKAIDTAWITA